MELLDVLDENANKTGKVEERSVVHEKGLWHAHVGVWLMNEKGELLFQQRASTKKSGPNKWTRTGGHVDSGETPLQAVQRETKEEVGVKIPINNFEFLKVDKNENIKPNNIIDRNFMYSYFAVVNYKLEDYTMQKEEVSQLKYLTIEDMKKAKENNDENYTFISWDDFDEIVATLEAKRDLVLNVEKKEWC